ncbi:MAG: relaxase/mobilization nuclease domain-containing protein, partial [Clostridia bacterium]|nr:relaxase/mobilization nuclease domain-containing protein [Clostridia bacterium]
MAIVKVKAGKGSLSDVFNYVLDKEKTDDSLISGNNCMTETAQKEFELTKHRFDKTDGRTYFHIVQSFSPEDKISPYDANSLGLEFAGIFESYQALVVTHTNREHLHNHIIVNSVSYEDGKKLHMEKADLEALKNYSNRLCSKYGLSATEVDTRAGKVKKWKKDLIHTAFLALAYTDTVDGFIGYMENHGYGVRWEADRKYITFTTPDGIKVRDNKLFDERLLKDNLELYYAMGGCLGPMANEYIFYKTPEHEPNAKQTMSTELVNLIGDFLSIAPERASYTPRPLTEMDKWEKERLEEILGKKISTEAFTCYCTQEEYEQRSGISQTM